jgi:hypothetical protein
MYSFTAMIVEMQTARGKLLKLFSVPNGASTSGFKCTAFSMAGTDRLFDAPQRRKGAPSSQSCERSSGENQEVATTFFKRGVLN